MHFRTANVPSIRQWTNHVCNNVFYFCFIFVCVSFSFVYKHNDHECVDLYLDMRLDICVSVECYVPYAHRHHVLLSTAAGDAIARTRPMSCIETGHGAEERAQQHSNNSSTTTAAQQQQQQQQHI